jgi:hypothetical protein
MYILENMKILTLGCSTTETDTGDLREGSLYCHLAIYNGKYENTDSGLF